MSDTMSDNKSIASTLKDFNIHTRPIISPYQKKATADGAFSTARNDDHE